MARTRNACDDQFRLKALLRGKGDELKDVAYSLLPGDVNGMCCSQSYFLETIAPYFNINFAVLSEATVPSLSTLSEDYAKTMAGSLPGMSGGVIDPQVYKKGYVWLLGDKGAVPLGLLYALIGRHVEHAASFMMTALLKDKVNDQLERVLGNELAFTEERTAYVVCEKLGLIEKQNPRPRSNPVSSYLNAIAVAILFGNDLKPVLAQLLIDAAHDVRLMRLARLLAAHYELRLATMDLPELEFYMPLVRQNDDIDWFCNTTQITNVAWQLIAHSGSSSGRDVDAA